ncbi:MAG: hypothetical protein R2769_15905 [Saprospiraceae bacterium]
MLKKVPFTQIIDDQARNNIYLKIELWSNGKPLADNIYFFSPGKDWNLSKAKINWKVDGKTISIESDKFAAYVYIDTQGKRTSKR